MKKDIDNFLGEIRLAKKISTGGQAATSGLAIIAGLMFLLGSNSSIQLENSQAIFAALLACFILGLTLINVLELIAGSGDLGGTYGLIQETTGGIGAFLAGWSIFLATIAVAAVLAKNAGSLLVLYFPSSNQTANLLALAFIAVLILIQVFQILPSKKPLWLLIALLLTVAIFMSIHAQMHLKMPELAPQPRVRNPGLLQAIALLAIGYLPFEAILSSRRQMRNPSRLLPTASAISLLSYLLVLIVALPLVTHFADSSADVSSKLIQILLDDGWLPKSFIGVISFTALIVALNYSLLTAARQINTLSHTDSLPHWLIWVRSPFKVPVLIYAVIMVLVSIIILWAPEAILIQVGSSLFLAAMIISNIAVIHSRRVEPKRRRSIRLPFYPLFPATALVLNIAILVALPFSALAIGCACLLVGALIYAFYGRSHSLAAQEGIIYFRPTSPRERKADSYRILIPIGPGQERYTLLAIATSLARQLGGELIPLQVIQVTDPLAIEEGRRIARERNTLFQWSLRLAEHAGVAISPITRLARNVPDGIIDTANEEDCKLILIPWSIIDKPARGAQMGQILDSVVRRAECDVAVVAYHPDGPSDEQTAIAGTTHAASADQLIGRKVEFHPQRILVPTAGGPHAPLAIRIALSLAREYDASVTAVYVVASDANQADIDIGHDRIQQTLDAISHEADALYHIQGVAGAPKHIPLDSKVIRADTIAAGIAEAGADFDLVMLGASEQRLIDQVLFGSIPTQVARTCPTPTIMVKRFLGLHHLWIKRIWDTLFKTIPTLTAEERITVYKDIRRDARPDIDFFIMMALSAIIATFGLLQDSSAVIIGAMLVAPLFSPILAIGLAIVQGDVRLLHLGIESSIKGIALAIGVALILTIPLPLHNLTHEIVARSQPNLFDLLIALTSGAAGAYAIARKDVAAALPGVAIAAALVPPISVIGIGLALGNLIIASGAALLLLTNLIAITLAATITLLLLGFHPTDRGKREVQLRQGMIGGLILLALIIIPLLTISDASIQDAQINQTIQETLNLELASHPDITLSDFDFEKKESDLEITALIYTAEPLDEAFVDRLSQELQQATELTVKLKLISIPVIEIQAESP